MGACFKIPSPFSVPNFLFGDRKAASSNPYIGSVSGALHILELLEHFELLQLGARRRAERRHVRKDPRVLWRTRVSPVRTTAGILVLLDVLRLRQRCRPILGHVGGQLFPRRVLPSGLSLP